MRHHWHKFTYRTCRKYGVVKLAAPFKELKLFKEPEFIAFVAFLLVGLNIRLIRHCFEIVLSDQLVVGTAF